MRYGLGVGNGSIRIGYRLSQRRLVGTRARIGAWAVPMNVSIPNMKLSDSETAATDATPLTQLL